MENTIKIKSPYSDDVLGTIINFLPNETVATVACSQAALPPFIVARWQLHYTKGEHPSKHLFRFLALSNVNSETQQLYNAIKDKIRPNNTGLRIAYKFGDLTVFKNLLSSSSEFDFSTLRKLFVNGLDEGRPIYSKLIWTHRAREINTLFKTTINENFTEEQMQAFQNDTSRVNGLLVLASFLGHSATVSFNKLITRQEIKPFAIQIALKQARVWSHTSFMERLQQHPLSTKQNGEQRSRQAPRILGNRQPFQRRNR